MRLIDTDKLRANFPEPTDWKDSKQALVHITGIWAEIDAAETVEAIPVDWIKAYIEEVDAMPDKLVWGHDKNAILTMLRAWEVREEQKGN